MTARWVRVLLLAVIVVGVAVSLRALATQQAPNATRVVIGADQSWCTPDGHLYRTGHTGWLPTENCFYPVPVPRVQR